LLGAIIGDIVGSRFEGSNHKGKDFELFDEECRATDDSVMTLAIAKAIMETEKIMNSEDDGMNDYYSLLEKMTVRCMQKIGRKYPYVGYGWWFSYWIFSDDPKPYNSFGNGAAMRISPVGHIAITESDVIKLSEVVTAVTHNHKEGIKGAEAVAMAIYMVRHGYTKEEIRQRIERDYYPLDFTIEGIKDTYLFDASCQNTVPQAIVAFLESVSFEDAIRNAVSIGGDSDTIAAITGSIAEAYYTVPEDLKEKALTYLDDELYSIYDEWVRFMDEKKEEGKCR
jgi:ADP-ribosyl-[dinitrogen reductase] hydrolase